MLSARDQHGYTPAHWAALDGSVAVMRYLVERGAPIDLSCLGTQVIYHTFNNLVATITKRKGVTISYVVRNC